MKPESASQAIADADRRLDQSRARLRARLRGEISESPMPASGPSPYPIGSSLQDALRTWLGRHPIVDAARLGSHAANQLLQPVARHHPLLLVGSALLAGGLLSWMRPWRGWLRPALVAGIGSQIASRLVATLPVERLLGGAIDLFADPKLRSRQALPPPSPHAP
jgi:hypothetical protein